jgi:hypothetical protein
MLSYFSFLLASHFESVATIICVVELTVFLCGHFASYLQKDIDLRPRVF